MHTLLFLDPGHFHAALTLRVPQARAADEVFVYAHEGAELRDFLALVERFNRRSPNPTRWRPVVTTTDDPLGRLVEERRGDVVVLAGRNGGKARTIRRLHESGFHVLADKPWLVEPADLEHVRASLEGWPLAAEIMTGRHDVAARLVKRLVGAPALFGGFRGDGPAIAHQSVHHLGKLVDGAPHRRSRNSRRRPPGAERRHGPSPQSVPRAPNRCRRGRARPTRHGHGVAGGAPRRRGRARRRGQVRGDRAAPARRGPRDALRPGPRRVPDNRGRSPLAHRARRAHAGQVHAARRGRGQGALMSSLERMNLFQEPEARVIIADLALPEGSRGLDVGCGVGLYALWLAEAIGPRGRVVGIEPSTERVEAARALVGHGPLASRLEFREGDATKLDAPDATFDWVWCGDVLHHVQETGRALGEFARVVRPGGRIVVKESQLLHGVFLPGHPALERRLRQAEMEWSRHEGGEFSFEERRQRTLASLRSVEGFRTYLLERRAPLPHAARDYIQHVVFERNWGPRLRDRLAPDDWTRRSALCEVESATFVLDDPDYYCLYPISVLVARR